MQDSDWEIEKKFWQSHGYNLLKTEDQSPSLQSTRSEASESMHHRGGAFTETQLIYGEPLRQTLNQKGRRVLSVGLGLGYNEILVAYEALKNKISPFEFQLLSFESENFLSESFLDWCSSRSSASIYNEIFHFFSGTQSGRPEIANSEVRTWLRNAFESGHWKLEKALTADQFFLQSYDCIFYDAFSSKTSPQLWEQEFLTKFLQKAASKNCQFTTYACTGGLKRALKAAGFEVILREGFQSKRNSTLGLR